jgi:cell division protease FtsH
VLSPKELALTNGANGATASLGTAKSTTAKSTTAEPAAEPVQEDRSDS